MELLKLKQYVDTHTHLVNKKDLGNGLFLLKYKNKVFYDNLWNDYLELCRGTIIDKDFNIVTMPFTKIYNYGIEAQAPKIAEGKMVTAHRKINGFMVAVSIYNDELLVSTTGTIDSKYVEYAKELLDLNTLQYTVFTKNKNITLLFECVHLEDPHIIKEEIGLYFLGYRENRLDSPINHSLKGNIDIEWVEEYNMMTTKSSIFIPETIRCTMAGVKELTKKCKHEGYVVYSDMGTTKIKSPYYLTTKFLARKEKLSIGMLIKEKFEEEYYGLIDKIKEDIDEFNGLYEQERINYIKDYFNKGY
jgi:hypothetical protein